MGDIDDKRLKEVDKLLLENDFVDMSDKIDTAISGLAWAIGYIKFLKIRIRELEKESVDG